MGILKMDEEISIELVNSIASEELSSVVRDMGEVVIDAVLNEGLLRDIPVFNTISALHKVGMEIRQRLFTKKVIIFLRELSNIPIEEREKFVKKIEQNPKQKQEFGETLLMLIDRADSLQKPAILGRLLKHHILGNISYDDATRLSFIVDRVYISDLNFLLKFISGAQTNPDIAASLHSVGLLGFAGVNLPVDLASVFEISLNGGAITKNDARESVIYELNTYGQLLLKYGLSSEE
jgi:hypothetical protein